MANYMANYEMFLFATAMRFSPKSPQQIKLTECNVSYNLVIIPTTPPSIIQL